MSKGKNLFGGRGRGSGPFAQNHSRASDDESDLAAPHKNGLKFENGTTTGAFGRPTVPSTSPPASAGFGSQKEPRTDSKPTENWQLRFTRLRVLRDKARKDAIRQGLMADPDKPRSLSDAITLVGTCQDMCPEFERVQRVVQNDVWDQEKTQSSFGGKSQPDESRMVKKFRRSAAGNEEQLPSDLRPPVVLKKTCEYLFNDVIGGAASLAQVHHFVWDRTRAIRNDLSIQQVTKLDDLRVAVECFELIVRFHILSLHQMAVARQSHSNYDPQQDREQMDNALLSLTQYYDDCRDRIDLPNEPEFRAYQVIFEIQNPKPDIESRVQNWPRRVSQDPRVFAALKLYAAACNTSTAQGPLRPMTAHPVARQDWERFWGIVSSDSISYLMACVAEIYFDNIRNMTLRAIIRTSRTPKAPNVSSDWTADDLLAVLRFEDMNQLHVFLQPYELELTEHTDGLLYLDLSQASREVLSLGKVDQPQRKSSLVEEKRCDRSLSAVINGTNAQQGQWLDTVKGGVHTGAGMLANGSGSHAGPDEQDSGSLFVSPPNSPQRTSNKATGAKFGSGATSGLTGSIAGNQFSSGSSSFGAPSVPAQPVQASISAFTTGASARAPSFGAPSQNTQPQHQGAVNGFPSPSPFGGSAFNPSTGNTATAKQSGLGFFQPKGTEAYQPQDAPVGDTAGAHKPLFGAATVWSGTENKQQSASSDSTFVPRAFGASAPMFASGSGVVNPPVFSPLTVNGDKPRLGGTLGSLSPERKSSLAGSTANPSLQSAAKKVSFEIPPTPENTTTVKTGLFGSAPSNTLETTRSAFFSPPGSQQQSSPTAQTPTVRPESNSSFAAPQQQQDPQQQTRAQPQQQWQQSQQTLQAPTANSSGSRNTPIDRFRSLTAGDNSHRPRSPSPLAKSFTADDNAPSFKVNSLTHEDALKVNARDAAGSAQTSAPAIKLPASAPELPDFDTTVSRIASELANCPASGILNQYVEFSIGQVIAQIQEQLYYERIDEEATVFRDLTLRVRYATKWREIYRHRRLLRKARERRARSHRRLCESQSGAQNHVTLSTPTSTFGTSFSTSASGNNLSTSAISKRNSKSRMQILKRTYHTIDALYQSTFGGKKSESQATAGSIRQTSSQPSDASKVSVKPPARRFPRDSDLVTGSKKFHGPLPKPRADLLTHSSFAGFPLRAIPDTTQSTYFRLKAMGIKTTPTSAAARGVKRAHADSTADETASTPAEVTSSPHDQYTQDDQGAEFMGPPPSKRFKSPPVAAADHDGNYGADTSFISTTGSPISTAAHDSNRARVSSHNIDGSRVHGTARGTKRARANSDADGFATPSTHATDLDSIDLPPLKRARTPTAQEEDDAIVARLRASTNALSNSQRSTKESLMKESDRSSISSRRSVSPVYGEGPSYRKRQSRFIQSRARSLPDKRRFTVSVGKSDVQPFHNSLDGLKPDNKIETADSNAQERSTKDTLEDSVSAERSDVQPRHNSMDVLKSVIGLGTTDSNAQEVPAQHALEDSVSASASDVEPADEPAEVSSVDEEGENEEAELAALMATARNDGLVNEYGQFQQPGNHYGHEGEEYDNRGDYYGDSEQSYSRRHYRRGHSGDDEEYDNRADYYNDDEGGDDEEGDGQYYADYEGGEQYDAADEGEEYANEAEEYDEEGEQYDDEEQEEYDEEGEDNEGPDDRGFRSTQPNRSDARGVRNARQVLQAPKNEALQHVGGSAEEAIELSD